MLNDSTSENVLLNRLAQGNEQAFRILFDSYKDKVYSFAFKFTKSIVQAEDIVQEIFLKVWRDRASMSKIENFESWLFIVARNKSFSVLKKMAFSFAYLQSQNTDTFAQSSEDQLLFKQYQQIVNNAVEQLSLQQKKIYKMRREEGLKIDEIAAQLHISPNTVKVHFTNALNQIRKALEGKVDAIVILIVTSLLAK